MDKAACAPASRRSFCRPSRKNGWVVRVELGLSRGLDRQFARTPYTASFTAHGHPLTPHHPAHSLRRHVREPHRGTQTIAECLGGIARSPRDEFERNLNVLGDFNIDRLGDPNWQAFISTGLSAPEELNDVPRTIKRTTGPQAFYDQIAWFTDRDGVCASPVFRMLPGRRVGHRCLRPTSSHHGGPTCQRLVALPGALATRHSSASATLLPKGAWMKQRRRTRHVRTHRRRPCDPQLHRRPARTERPRGTRTIVWWRWYPRLCYGDCGLGLS